MRHDVRQLFVLVALCAGLLVVSCNDDKPTEPDPEKDYPVYIADINQPRLFTYYPQSRTIDSANIPWRAEEGITVSADGRLLYLALYNEVVVVDAGSLTEVTRLPYQPDDQVAVSPDNRLVAIANGGLHLLSTSDYSVVFDDTVPVIHCRFSEDNQTLYCVRQGTGSVYTVDLGDSTYPTSVTEVSDGLLHFAVPSVDERKLMLYARYDTFLFAFEVYDRLLDSTVFQDVLVPGFGQVEITPDGRFAIYTNPGRSGTDPLPPGTFTIYDVETNTILDTVSTLEYELPPCICAPNMAAISPGGRWLIVIAGIQLAPQVLYLYDLEHDSLVHYHDFGTVVLTNPTVQQIK